MTDRVIDVGLQRSGEVRMGLLGGENQCVRCFKDTEGSGSADFCAQCLIELRGGR